jgi:predicted DCC family thiol-disulfide oxidoreductase YuxK
MIEPSHQPAVILFDGECTLCDAWVSFLLRHDTRGCFRFAPRQSEAASRLLRPFGVEPDHLGSIALIVDTTLYTRSDAILQILGRLGFPWRVLSGLSVIPRPLRDRAYSLLARNRYRLAGRRDQCRTAGPEDGDRFLR